MTESELGASHPRLLQPLNNLGLAMRHECSFPEARAMYQESIALRRELGDNTGVATALHNAQQVSLVQEGAA
jgi:hypothetical protein